VSAPAANPSPPPAPPTALRRRLALRAGVRAGLRDLFDRRGFVEVDTPVLSLEVLPEAHIDPIAVAVDGPGHAVHWLQASPEALMKRLLAGGSGPIYQFAPSFRAGERGAMHDVEFVLVEWYAPAATLDTTAALLEAVCSAVLGTQGLERLSCRDAFARHAGIDIPTATLADWRDAGSRLGLGSPHGSDDSPDTWFELLLSEVVGPRLGRDGRPTTLELWPASQSAFARLDPHDPRLARRFELFVNGIELANGWEEDTGRELLAARIDAANRVRAAAGRPVLPVPHRLLDAHGHSMPEGVGAALGFDRLVMLAAGATSLDGARPFPTGAA
jgi:lysyl-tRNA synthetase class 2